MKIELRNLSHQYRGALRPSLNEVSVTLGSGEFWAVAGPNGSGKSTLLKAVAAFSGMEAAASNVFLDTHQASLISRSELAKKLAFVPSHSETRFPISVWNFVLQGRFPYLMGLSAPGKKDEEYAESAIDRAGIAEWKDRDIRELSTGEKQLAVFARALAQDTKAILIDEGVANLDLKVQRRILHLLAEKNRAGATVLLVTHDLNLIGEHIPNVLWMRAGKVVAQGATKNVFTSQTIGEAFDVQGQVTVFANPRTGHPQISWN